LCHNLWFFKIKRGEKVQIFTTRAKLCLTKSDKSDVFHSYTPLFVIKYVIVGHKVFKIVV